jgi:hypothetical protein
LVAVVSAGVPHDTSILNPGALLGYARLMNGVCPKCGKINDHLGKPRCSCALPVTEEGS